MPDHVKDVYRTILERTARSLEANNMKCFIANTKEDVLPIVKELLTEGETVSCGGSMSLAETGVAELLRSGAYDFLDRTGKSPEEAEEIYRRAFSRTATLQAQTLLPKTASFTTWTETATV